MTEDHVRPHDSASGARERGTGDWSNYQSPSAVLSAIAASNQAAAAAAVAAAPRPPGTVVELPLPLYLFKCQPC